MERGKASGLLNILFPSLRRRFQRDFGAPGVPRGSRSGHSRAGAFVWIDAQGPRRPQHTFTDGSVYTGEWAGEVKHGSGTQARADSSIHRFDSRPKGAAGACGVSVCVCVCRKNMAHKRIVPTFWCPGCLEVRQVIILTSSQCLELCRQVRAGSKYS